MWHLEEGPSDTAEKPTRRPPSPNTESFGPRFEAGKLSYTTTKMQVCRFNHRREGGCCYNPATAKPSALVVVGGVPLQPPALGRQSLPMVVAYSDLLSLWVGHASATLTALALFPTLAFSFRISPAFLTTLLLVGDQFSFLFLESCLFICPYYGL